MSLTRILGQANRRRPRRFGPEVSTLEGRALLSGVENPLAVSAVPVGTLGQNGWYVSPVTVNLSASDPGDPTDPLQLFSSVDGAATVAGNQVNLAADGIHTVSYYAVDPDGQTSPTQTLTVKIDQTAPVVTIDASPTTLWPPNHKLVPVTVTGSVADATSGPAGTVSYRVVDSYGQVQPSGTTSLNGNHYAFTVMLQSSRLGQDRAGRTYTIYATGTDQAGNSTTVATTVLVPHDQGHHNGPGPQGPHGPHGPRGGHNPKHGRPAFVSTPVVNSSLPVVVVNPDEAPGHGNGHGNGHDNGNDNGNGNGNGNDNGHGHGNGNGGGDHGNHKGH